jgi:proteasome lid subunit RPN8/RPN11
MPVPAANLATPPFAHEFLDWAPRLLDHARTNPHRRPVTGTLADLHEDYPPTPYRVRSDRRWSAKELVASSRTSSPGAASAITVFRRRWRRWRRGQPTGVFFADPLGISYAHARTGRVWRFPIIGLSSLHVAVVRAMKAEAGGILDNQTEKGWEIGGLITADEDSLSDIRVTTCEQVNGDPFSSDPYCNGRRPCRERELTPGRVVVGEFHSHPLPYAPPSGHDLFQLKVAVHAGIHNCSVVVAPEGLYVNHMPLASFEALLRDVNVYYAQNGVPPEEVAAALGRCRQPIPKLIANDGSTPLLAAFFKNVGEIYRGLNPPRSQEGTPIDIDFIHGIIDVVHRHFRIHTRFVRQSTKNVGQRANHPHSAGGGVGGGGVARRAVP